MHKKWIIPLLALILISSALAPPVAAQPSDNGDECENADEGPSGDGPPGFVGGLMPDFLSDLFAALPVPNVVKSFFGAPTC